MGAPVEFVVTRHLLSHPDEGTTDMARHCNLHVGSVSAARRRLQKQDIWRPAQLLAHLQTLSRRPPRRATFFHVPNPDQFIAALRRDQVPFWISGDAAAAAEGYDLVPEHVIIYIHPEAADPAMAAAIRVYGGKVAASAVSNVEIRVADDWLYLDPESELVERGQRLLDYQESKHIQILRDLEAHL